MQTRNGVLLAGGEYADLMGTTDLNIRLITGGDLYLLMTIGQRIMPICFLNMGRHSETSCTDEATGFHICVLPN